MFEGKETDLMSEMIKFMDDFFNLTLDLMLENWYTIDFKEDILFLRNNWYSMSKDAHEQQISSIEFEKYKSKTITFDEGKNF